MKRWKKRLTLFSLLLAGSMVWNISGVRVKAEDAVPQVTINIKNGKDVKVNGVEVSIRNRKHLQQLILQMLILGNIRRVIIARIIKTMENGIITI